MKLLKRSAITTAILAGTLTLAASPALAIVDGQDATQPYPGIAAITVQYPDRVGTCVGLLNTPRTVVVPAHCVSDPAMAPTPAPMPASTISLRIGTLDRTSGGRVTTGRTVLLFPDWEWGAHAGTGTIPTSNLALVELAKPVFGVPVMPISGKPVREGATARVVGWGYTMYPPTADTTMPTILQQRDVTVLPSSACTDGPIGVGELCVSPGVCMGEGGAPAMTRPTGRHARGGGWKTWGIASHATSHSAPCTNPIILTDLTYPPFRQWITEASISLKPMPRTNAPAGALKSGSLTRLDLLMPTIH